MEKKLIVSNSTPLINFASIGMLHILHELFNEIIIPDAVERETVIDGKVYPSSEAIKKASWIKKESIHNKELYHAIAREVDPGESESIVLAIEKDADLILLDELEAREIAGSYRLKYIGSIGCLVEAKNKRIIPSIKPLLDRMIEEANFWINRRLYEKVLVDNKE